MKQLRQPYSLYLLLIISAGAFLVLAGLLQLPALDNYSRLLLFLALGAASAVATTSMSVSEEAGITYEIHNAVSIATVALFGPLVATLVVVVSHGSMWLIKPVDRKTWKKSFQQLAFNIAMFSISIAVAGWGFVLLRSWLGPDTILGITVPWIAAAIIFGQVNAALLIGILYLQHEQKISPAQIWRDNRWYMFLDAIVMSVGGAVLAFAAQEYGWIGTVIFFLPIILSTFAFRFYVRQMEDHMSNLEAIVAERTRELREVSEEKDAFLAVLTHDMKTPLTSIGLYATIIQQRPRVIEEKPEMADIIVRNQQVLLDIVNNILDLEKLQSHGSLPMEEEELELVALTESVVEGLRPLAEHKEIALESQLPPPPLLAYGDPSQIERILMNLVSNGIKYTPKGGEGKVLVEMEQRGKAAIFRIIDNGYGIPAEDLPHIFERYRRVGKHKDKAVGTGLGLSVTRALVEAHGGEIEVESEEDAGSTFTVTLPILRFPHPG